MTTKESQILEVNKPQVARKVIGGALAGAGGISAMNLANYIQRTLKERKRMRSEDAEGKDTIVITLPPRSKKAEAPTTVKSIECPDIRTLVGRCGPQLRRLNGKYMPGKLRTDEGAKTAQDTGWPTLTAGWVGAGVGAFGGAAIANKLYARAMERKEKRELEAAKEDYVRALTGYKVKGAAVVDVLLDIDQPASEEKSASFWGMLNYPLAAYATLATLGTGATAYLTKRILDERSRELEDKGLDVPKTKRIVFRSAPEDDPEKQASPEDREAVIAALAVTMDRLSGTTKMTGDPAVVKAASDIGLTPADLIEKSADIDNIMSLLFQESNAPLRAALTQQFARTNYGQIGGFAAGMLNKIGPGRRFMDDKLRKGITDRLGPQTTPATKAAAARSSSAFIASLIGSSRPVDIEQLARAVTAEKERKAREKEMAGTRVKEPIRIEGADENASRYIAENSDRLTKKVQRLAARGHL